MATTHRWLRLGIRLSALVAGLLIVVLVVTQTPWFRDWLRRTAMRQAERFVEGQLVIGRLEGRLFNGVTLTDVSIVQAGAPVISIDRVAVTWGLTELLSDGRVIAHLDIQRPVVRVVESATGWNVARLLKPRPPTDPNAPRATFWLPDIVVSDGLIEIDAAGVEPSPSIPRRITGLTFRGGVRSLPEALSIDVRGASWQTSSPDMTLQSLSGRLFQSDDGWRFEQVVVATGESSLRVHGALSQQTSGGPRVFDLAVASPMLSLPEVGRFVPAIAYLEVRPALDVAITGTLDALGLEVAMESEAGSASGPLTLDLTGPARAIAGTLALERVDLAQWTGDPDAAGRITGAATFDLQFPSATPDVALDGTFAFRGAEASAYGYAATDVTAEGRLRGRRLELNTRASAYGGRVTARGHIDRPGPGRPEVVVSLAGRIADIDLRRLPDALPVPELETSLAGAYAVDGPLSRLRATGTLEASTVEGATLAEGLTAAFQRDGATSRFEATGDVEGLDLIRLGRALDIEALQDERYAGVVSGAFTVEGVQQPQEDLRLAASGTLRDTRILGGRLPSMAFDVLLASGALDVTAKGQVEAYDLAALSGTPALTGTLTGDVETSVRLASLDDVALETVSLTASVALIRPTVLDVPFQRITADVRLDEGVIDVRALESLGDGFTLTGQGAIATGDVGASDFAYRLEASSLVNPAKVADLPLQGAAVAEGRLTGARGAFQAVGTLTGTDVAYADSVTAEAFTADYTIRLPDLDTARLDVEARIDAETVVVAGLPLVDVQGTVGYVPATLSFDVQARDAARTLHGAGAMTLGEGSQVVTLRELGITRDTVQWALASGTEGVLTVSPQALVVSPLTLASGAQTLVVDGRVALATGETHALTVTASGVDVADALVLAGQDIDADGTLRLDARLGGTLDVPTLAGSLDVTEGRYRDLPIALIQATVDDDGQLAEVDAIVRQSDAAYVTAKGIVPHTLFLPDARTQGIPQGADRLALDIRSTSIDLALAEGLTDQLRDLAGRAELDIRLTNTGREPVVAGEVVLSDAAFLVTETGVAYRNVSGLLAFEDDHVTVRQLSAESQNGRPLQVTGEIGLRNESTGTLALSVSGKGVRVLDNELGQMDLDSTLEITGTLAAPVIEGDLVVTNGRLEVDVLLPRFAVGTYDTEPTYQGIPTYRDEDALPVVPDILGTASTDETADEESDASRAAFVYDDMALNVRVRIPDNLVLRGRNVEVGGSGIGDVNVTMGGDFRVAKAAGEQLVLIGTVNTVRGTYSYQGRRFDIARDGQVLFRGDGTTNPSLDITAERVIQGVEARVRIQGTAEEPTLSLSSDPPLDEADVLALIVFNQPLNQLGTGQQNTLAQRAGGVAAGFAVSPIAQALGNTLDLDLFDVETTDPSGRVNPAVVIGQQVNQDLFVKFRQQFGNQQVSQFLLEYRLADFLRLQSSVAEGEGLARGNRSLTQRIERYGADLVFYFAF